MDKVVRFYRPLIIEKNDSVSAVPTGFWKAAHQLVQKASAADRRFKLAGSLWYGDAGVGTKRAYEYFRCGRVRLPGDWPAVVDNLGGVTPLTLSEGNLFEAAYLVPFGNKERVSLVGPLHGTVAKSSLEAWLGALLELPKQGRSLKLEPLIDEELATKLAESVGVSRLSVNLPANEEFVPPDGEQSEVEAAILSSNSLGAGLDRNLTFSYGRRKKGEFIQPLLQAARRLVRAEGVTKVEATLLLPAEEGFRSEVHELLEDRIVIRASFNVDENAQPSSEDMLDGVHSAIEEFLKPSPSNGAQRT